MLNILYIAQAEAYPELPDEMKQKDFCKWSGCENGKEFNIAYMPSTVHGKLDTKQVIR